MWEVSVGVAYVLKAGAAALYGTVQVAAVWLLLQVDNAVQLLTQSSVAALILGAAIWVMRWTFQVGQHAEDRYVGVITTLEAENARLARSLEARDDRIDELVAELAEVRDQYRQEFLLREALERGRDVE